MNRHFLSTGCELRVADTHSYCLLEVKSLVVMLNIYICNYNYDCMCPNGWRCVQVVLGAHEEVHAEWLRVMVNRGFLSCKVLLAKWVRIGCAENRSRKSFPANELSTETGGSG